MSETSKKLKTLVENNEDFEWYPTTDEIIAAMNKDLRRLFVKDRLAEYCARNRRNKLFSYSPSQIPRQSRGLEFMNRSKRFLLFGFLSLPFSPSGFVPLPYPA
jgi:hypothetical protein